MRDGNGARVDWGKATTRYDGRVLQVNLKPLPPSVYTVEWHVASVDTNKAAEK